MFTYRIDAVSGDTIHYADYRNRQALTYPVEVVVKSFGATDTLLVKQMSFSRRKVGNAVVIDTGWLTVPLLNLLTNTQDTLVYVNRVPLQATNRAQDFKYARFLIYTAFTDQTPWRIERYSGIGYPVAARNDSTKTHMLEFEFQRRK